MNKPQKAIKLINYLEEMVVSGRFAAESKIPPIRQLTSEFNISYGTALAGIDYLCQSGLLTKKNRSGIFVNSQNTTKNGEIEIVVFSIMHSGGMYATAFSGIQEYAEKNNIVLRQCELAPIAASADIFKQLSLSASGVLMLSEYDTAMEQLPLDKPCVGILMHNTFKGHMSIVDIDPFCSAELAVDYFKSKKLKKVNIFTDPRLAYYNRGTIFAQYWKNAGGECELFVGRDVEVEFNNKEGYFFTSDNLLYDYSCRYEKEHGVQLAKRFIVLGVDGKNLIFPNFHKFPTIATDWRVIGKYAIEECMYRIKELGSRPKRIYVPGDLIVNQ